jgi:hypothetical protein
VKITPRTAGKVKDMLARFVDRPPVDRSLPSTGSGSVWARCNSTTPAGTTGVDAKCYPGTLLLHDADNLDPATLADVWLTPVDPHTAPSPDTPYRGQLLGSHTISGVTKPRVIIDASRDVTAFVTVTSSTVVAGAQRCVRRPNIGPVSSWPYAEIGWVQNVLGTALPVGGPYPVRRNGADLASDPLWDARECCDPATTGCLCCGKDITDDLCVAFAASPACASVDTVAVRFTRGTSGGQSYWYSGAFTLGGCVGLTAAIYCVSRDVGGAPTCVYEMIITMPFGGGSIYCEGLVSGEEFIPIYQASVACPPSPFAIVFESVNALILLCGNVSITATATAVASGAGCGGSGSGSDCPAGKVCNGCQPAGMDRVLTADWILTDPGTCTDSLDSGWTITYDSASQWWIARVPTPSGPSPICILRCTSDGWTIVFLGAFSGGTPSFDAGTNTITVEDITWTHCPDAKWKLVLAP